MPRGDPRQGGPQAQRLWLLETVATPQDALPGEAKAPRQGPGAQNQSCCRHWGQGTPGADTGHRRCARRGRWEADAHQEPAEDWPLVAWTPAPLHHLQGGSGGDYRWLGRGSLYQSDLSGHLAGWDGLLALLSTHGARVSLPRFWFDSASGRPRPSPPAFPPPSRRPLA